MSLFSKLTKNNDKSIYPWSQRKISGANGVFPRSGHASAVLPSDQILVFGGIHRNTGKKELFLLDSKLKYIYIIICFIVCFLFSYGNSQYII